MNNNDSRSELYRQEAEIEAQATSDFGTYSPVRVVECPHCGGRMQAIDAKVHVRTTNEWFNQVTK